MSDHVMSYDMHVYTYLVGQYEFSDSRKVRMILLLRGLC